ncbi:MAG: hypothetical protein ACIAQZ_01865 [Sedimentisphaeraceae bacterium JB056]
MMRIRGFLGLILLCCCYCAAQTTLLYDVDFSSPPHTLGETVVVDDGVLPRKGPKEIRFGEPKVVSSVGALTDQPLSLSGYGAGGNTDYSQIYFGFDDSFTAAFPKYYIEMDVLIECITGNLTLVLDTPSVRTLKFHDDGSVAIWGTNDAGVLDYSYSAGVPFHIGMDVDLTLQQWNIYIDGTLIKSVDLGAESLGSFRISNSSSSDLGNSVAIDNVKIYSDGQQGPILTKIEIEGPALVNNNAQFKTYAYYDNGNIVDVTQDATWSLFPNLYAEISDSGFVKITEIAPAYEGSIAVLYYDSGMWAMAEKTIMVEPASGDYYVGGIYGSDNNDGLSPETAFATIQFAIDSAALNDRIIVFPGTYQENIYFDGKPVTVEGAGGDVIIDGGDQIAVSLIDGEDGESVLKNVTILNSYIGVFASGSSPVIQNVNFLSNFNGLMALNGAGPDVVNCIFWYNSTQDISGCYARYSCVERIGEGVGEGNIFNNPLFADFENGDYRLRSELGRYRPDLDLWVVDEATSPCVNSGDPGMDVCREIMPHGGRINMGAYGGTMEASRGDWTLEGDFNRDGIVDMSDLAKLTANWLNTIEWMTTAEN